MVFGGKQLGPFVFGEDALDHESVDIYLRRLSRVRTQHAHFLFATSIGCDVSALP